jgi:cellulose synthase/poly-beta-1,6-N-acetylglucosamine synthase-like glycosyltransferase
MLVAVLLLVAGGGLVFYILVGYPLLLAMLPARGKPPIKKDLNYQPSVSLILSIFNGAAYVRAKLETIFALDYPRDLLQIIVVSDGSTDESEALVREYADRGVELYVQPHWGKASAVNLALAHARGELLFLTDIRQPLDRMALRHLAANFADPTVGAVTGEMRLLKSEAGEQADMDLYWRYELWARRRHSAIDSLFNTTGCIYAMRRELAKPMRRETLSDDAALPLGAFFRGYRIVFDPEAIAYDYPALPGTEGRRRFRNLAGLWQTFAWNPQLFTASRMRVHFLSHKFGRLVLPWALLLTLAGSVALGLTASIWWPFMAEMAIAALAWLDGIMPREFPLKRLTSPVRTFIVMNSASLRAIQVFFRKPEKLWVPTKVNASEQPVPGSNRGR